MTGAYITYLIFLLVVIVLTADLFTDKDNPHE